MFIFNLNVVFTMNFLKWRQSVCALGQDSSQEQDFMVSNLLQRGSNYRWST
jgi:hypothetical protein